MKEEIEEEGRVEDEGRIVHVEERDETTDERPKTKGTKGKRGWVSYERRGHGEKRGGGGARGGKEKKKKGNGCLSEGGTTRKNLGAKGVE